MYSHRCCNIGSSCFDRDDYVSIEKFNFPEFNANYRCNICDNIINDSCEFPKARLKNKEYTFCKLDCYYKWLLKKK